ncbi:MAG: ABC transporter substrate-binding protein, partial [Mariprofundaceae bacterium]
MRERIALAALALAALAACSQESPDPGPGPYDRPVADIPAPGDRLVDASIGDATNLIPMIAGDAASHAIAGQLYLSLLKYDRNLDLTGQLAESWQVSEDNRTIRFRLRPNLRWSDGVPLTSADCAFTLRLIQDPQTQSAYKSDYMRVRAIETPDPRTFVVHYDEPFSPALASWASLAILPEHVFRGEDIMHTPLARHPKATIGPYRLAEWQPQQFIRLRANPDYYDGPVWITERLTRIIPDTATQFLELSAGRLDSMGLTPIQYRRLFEMKPLLRRDYRRYRYLDFVYTYLGFNLRRPLFTDVRVRRAIALAIDREEIVTGVLLGLGETIASPYKPGTYWVNKNLKPRPYDPEKARKLLGDAGWSDHDGDGLLDRDGQPLSFT